MFKKIKGWFYKKSIEGKVNEAFDIWIKNLIEWDIDWAWKAREYMIGNFDIKYIDKTKVNYLYKKILEFVLLEENGELKPTRHRLHK